MKMSRWLLVVVFCGVFVSSCFNPPEYPDTPEIIFKSVQFFKGGAPLPDGGTAGDSIVIKLTFKDGNGDVGVDANDLAPPFNDRWYYLREPGIAPNDKLAERLVNKCGFDPVTNRGIKCWQYDTLLNDLYLNYSDRNKNGYFDTLKNFHTDFSDPYNCTNWEVVSFDKDPKDEIPPVPQDTLYFQLNPHYPNIFVEFQIATGDPNNPYQAFVPQDFFTYDGGGCAPRPFDGRIPVLSEDLSTSTPLEGSIRYAIASASFRQIFGAQTLRLKVYIEDRAYNKSNVIVTNEFTLTEN
jgi:hypothetical protein